MQEHLTEIKAVWRGEVTQALKSGRIVALLGLYLLFTMLALLALGYANYRINGVVAERMAEAGITAEQARQSMVESKKGLLDYFFDEPLLSSLASLPLVLTVVFKMSMLFVPPFVALMGFDQVSGEVGPKSIRYYVVRVRRSSLLLAKFLTQLTLFAGLTAVNVVVMTVVAKALNSEFEVADALLWLARLLTASLAFGVAYLGLTSLCSSLVRTPPVSLTINVMGLFVIWAVSVFGSVWLLPGEKPPVGSFTSQFRSESLLGYARYASIWHFQERLLHPDFATVVASMLVHLGFACACLGVAMMVLRQRDV